MTERVAEMVAAIVLAEPAALGLWRVLRWLWRTVDGLFGETEHDVC